ncbi:MAG: hypothetical protein R2681_03645 [Pyrinomonadaceae bacterium]
MTGYICVVGMIGVEKVIEIPLDEDELAGIRRSAEALKPTMQEAVREAVAS